MSNEYVIPVPGLKESIYSYDNDENGHKPVVVQSWGLSQFQLPDKVINLAESRLDFTLPDDYTPGDRINIEIKQRNPQPLLAFDFLEEFMRAHPELQKEDEGRKPEKITQKTKEQQNYKRKQRKSK